MILSSLPAHNVGRKTLIHPGSTDRGQAMTTHSLAVPGVRLHYEVRGTSAGGPLRLLLGAPMPAADFAPLAEALASDHTVVTTDPRGIANSPLDDPQ
jgi:hypothetical protein